MFPLLVVAILSIAASCNANPNEGQKKAELFSTQDVLKAQQQAIAWAAESVKTTGKESVVLANMLLAAHTFATLDNQARKQLAVIVALSHAITSQAREYADSSENRALLNVLLERHKNTQAQLVPAMATWKACDNYITNHNNPALTNALTAFQAQSQSLLQSHIQFHNDALNKSLINHHKACAEDTATLHNATQLTQLLSQDKLPAEITDQNNLIAYKVHFINELSTCLEDLAMNTFATASILNKTVTAMQDASCVLFTLYYNALYAALKKAGYAPSAHIMFDATGLIPANKKMQPLPESIQ